MVRDLEKTLWAAADKLSNPDVKDDYLVENVFFVSLTAWRDVVIPKETVSVYVQSLILLND